MFAPNTDELTFSTKMWASLKLIADDKIYDYYSIVVALHVCRLKI